MIRRFHFLSPDWLHLIISRVYLLHSLARSRLLPGRIVMTVNRKKKKKKNNQPTNQKKTLCPDLSMTLHENTWQNIQEKGKKLFQVYPQIRLQFYKNAQNISRKCPKPKKESFLNTIDWNYKISFRKEKWTVTLSTWEMIQKTTLSSVIERN